VGVNIYDVAKKARVSSATVSRVMNGSPYVRETTKSRVVKAIAELDYTPNAVARKLSTGDTGSIGFLVPDIENPFFTHLLRGITDAADKHGYNIFLCSTEDSAEKERRYLASMRAERMSGMLVIPVEAGSESLWVRDLDWRTRRASTGPLPSWIAPNHPLMQIPLGN